jgi:hypothetical protein
VEFSLPQHYRGIMSLQEIDIHESNKFFALHANSVRDFFPDNIEDVVIEWAEKVVEGELNIRTHQDTRKYEYRVRALRMKSKNILMDTGKYVKAHIAHNEVDKFLSLYKEAISGGGDSSYAVGIDNDFKLR